MRRSIVAKGLVLAMEGDEVNESSAGEYEEAMDEVNEGVEEINESEAEIEDIEIATDSAIDDADTLEDISEVMEESVEKGEGLDETSAEIAEIAIESICARLGIKVQDRLLPATESFGSDNSRVAATRIALETVKETLKRAWEAIKNALKTVRDKIVELYKKYLTALGSVKRAYEKLTGEVAKFKGGELADDKKEISSKYIARAFSGPNADSKYVTTYSDVGGIIDNHNSATSAVVDSGTHLSSVIKDLDFNSFDGEKTKKSSLGVVQALSSAWKSVFTPGSEKGKAPKSTLDTAGNQFKESFISHGIAVMVGGATLEAISDPTFKGWSSRIIFSFMEASKAEKIQTMTVDQINELMGKIKSLLDSTDSFVKSSSKYQEQIKALNKVADTIINLRETEAETDEAKEKIKNIKTEYKAVSDVINSTRKSIPGLNVKCIKASMAYVNASMGQY